MSRHALRIKKGHKVMESIVTYCKENNISNASISAIGAVEQAELGYLKGKAYIKKTFVEDHELISLLGNVTISNNEPFVHAHVSISDENFTTYSGHLFEAIVSATCEVFIDEIHLEQVIERQFDEETGLRIWNI